MLKLDKIESLYNGDPKRLGNIYVVGKEPNNVYLIARDDLVAGKTCIEAKCYDERKILFKNEARMKVVSASVNYHQNILAFTSVRVNEKNKTEKIYESYLVEINSGTKYLLYIEGSKHFQNIQFLNNSRKNLSYILFLRDQEKIEMYSIGIEEKNGKIYQPELQGTFIKQHVWSNWDPETSILSYISKKSSFFVLTSCSFQDISKPAILYEQELYLNIPSEISYSKLPWLNGHRSPNTSIHFTLIHFQNNILLCQQVIKEDNAEEIEIIIFALHLKLKFSFVIPIHTDEKFRVLFANMNELLMIYIPGYYMKFMDCSKSINDILTWKLDEKNTSIPFSTDNLKSSPSLLFFPKLHTLFDIRKGLVYQFDINLEEFFKWFQKEESNKNLTHALYFVINFIKKSESMVKDMLKDLIKRNLLTNEIIIEYLLDMTFIQSKEHFDDDFLKYIPTRYSNMKVQTTSLENSIKFKTPLKMNPIKIISPCKFPFIDLIRDTIVYNYQLKSPILREEKRSSSFFNFFTPNKNVQMVKMSDTELFQTAIEETLMKDLKDQKNIKFCNEYARIVVEVTNTLFDFICDKNESSIDYYHILENFYCALEETSYPPPEEFFEHFILVGYKVLKPNIFIQYIERNIFKVTESLIEAIFNENKFDSQTKFYVLRRLFRGEYHDRLSQDLPILIQFYHAKISSLSPQELLISYNNEVEKNAEVNDKFIPFVYFKLSIQQSLNKNQKIEIKFIHENLNDFTYDKKSI
eukprot:gene6364-10370_t